MTPSERLKDYWRRVRSGELPPPKRKTDGAVARVSKVKLDGSFGPDRNKRLVFTLHSDGRLELRPERTRRPETVHLVDVYRWAVRCRADQAARVKRDQVKARKAQRLADARQARAERWGL